MKLILIRHAYAEHQSLGIIAGQMDWDLTKAGIKESFLTAKFLAQAKIDYAYISPQTRTRQTDKIILKNHPETKIIFAPELKDRHFGKYQNKKRQILQKIRKPDWLEFDFQGGETWKDLENRVLKILKQILKSRGTVLIVSHGDPLAVMLLFLLKKDITQRSEYLPDNCAVSIFDDGKPMMINSTEHLR